MTHISGTSQLKPKKSEQKTNKEDHVQKKITTKSKTWYLEQKYWIRAGIGVSMASIILGFLIYKSFFILALFVPISLLAIWFIIKFFEEHISKFDSFEK